MCIWKEIVDFISYFLDAIIIVVSEMKIWSFAVTQEIAYPACIAMEQECASYTSKRMNYVRKMKNVDVQEGANLIPLILCKACAQITSLYQMVPLSM